MSFDSLLAYHTFSLEKLNALLGFSLNALLLYLIRRFSNEYVGNYKYLLAIFALFDIYLSVSHGLLNPVVIIVANTFACALYVPWQSHELKSIFFSAYTVPFALMNIHFLYRYWSAAHPYRLVRFSQPLFVVTVSLYPIAQVVIWIAMAMSMTKESGDACLTDVKAILLSSRNVSIDDGWVVMDNWRDGKFNIHGLYIIIICMVIMVSSGSSAITLATLTYIDIRSATNMSPKHRTIQNTLLAAVCAQTLVPILFVYIPYFLAIFCPFWSIPVFGVPDHLMDLLAFFPGWDAIVIIVMIKDYRLGLMVMLRIRKTTTTTISIHSSMSTIAPNV